LFFLIRKIALVLSVISLICVVALTGTKFLNIGQMEISDDNASSYHDLSPVIYAMVGILMMFSGYLTWRVSSHISAFILPFGLGITCLGYGLYILYAKGVITF